MNERDLEDLALGRLLRRILRDQHSPHHWVDVHDSPAPWLVLDVTFAPDEDEARLIEKVLNEGTPHEH